jgi:predicted ATP-binding protein involved in virulence
MAEIFITEIEIKKVRHLQNIKIKLSDKKRKHLILTGKNGSGKTSVILELNNNLPGVRQLNPTADLQYQNRILSSSSIKWSQFPNDHWSTFIMSLFQAKRHTHFSKPDGVKAINASALTRFNNEHPQQIFLQHIVNLKATRSFAKDEHIPNVATIEQIDLWFETFEDFLKSIYQDDTLRLVFDSSNFNFTIATKGREQFDFLSLSHGYSSIIDIISNIILKSDYLKIPLNELQGVVLIDEIETHLHIDLQKKIMPFLTTVFPKIQFIVTTHSPFVLNSIDNAVIYDLENKIQVEDLSGYSVDGIIESYFNSDKYSQKLKDKISEYEELIGKIGSLNEDERDRMVELSIYFRNIPKFYAPELEVKIQQLELLKLAKKQ